MNELTISGAQFRDMIVAGAALLERNRQAIDALNVFPVPDGDTGTNMTMTMQSAVRELRALPADATVSAVADALSMGALRGARGNSGVILSQLFRGFSRAFKGASVMDAPLLASALTMGSEAAYKAVMKPKEGTILTVSRMIAEDAAALAERGMDDAAHLLQKDTFGAPELPGRIAAALCGAPEEVVLAGVCTDICVISNALLVKAFFPEARVAVDAACCAGVTPKSHQTALDAMRACQIDVL